MTVNLFVKLPTTHPGTTGGEYFDRSGANLLRALSGTGGPSLLIHTWIAFSLVIGAIALFCTKPSKWQTTLAVGQRHRSVAHAVDAVQRYEFHGLQQGIQPGDHGRLLAHRRHCIGRPAGADQNHGGSRIRDRHRWIDRTSRSARGTANGTDLVAIRLTTARADAVSLGDG